MVAVWALLVSTMARTHAPTTTPTTAPNIAPITDFPSVYDILNTTSKLCRKCYHECLRNVQQQHTAFVAASYDVQQRLSLFLNEESCRCLSRCV